jgi:hypothetical protein
MQQEGLGHRADYVVSSLRELAHLPVTIEVRAERMQNAS